MIPTLSAAITTTATTIAEVTVATKKQIAVLKGGKIKNAPETIVRFEIIDMLIKKLLDFVLEKVKELLAAAMELLVLEQVEYYMKLLRQMLENCAFALPKRPNLATTLDNVDYADIDANDTPVTNEC